MKSNPKSVVRQYDARVLEPHVSTPLAAELQGAVRAAAERLIGVNSAERLIGVNSGDEWNDETWQQAMWTHELGGLGLSSPVLNAALAQCLQRRANTCGGYFQTSPRSSSFRLSR